MIVISGAKLVSFDPPGLTQGQDLTVDGGRIKEVGPGLIAKYPAARVFRTAGFLSPGLVCSHTHLYSVLARGLGVRIEPSKDFVQQLEHLWWRLDRAVDDRSLQAAALAGAAEAVRCGVTALVDHNESPQFIDGSLGVIRAALDSIGMRGLLCYGVTDRNGPSGARDGIRENIRFAKAIDAEKRKGGKPLVEAAVGAHASFTIGPGTLESLASASRDTGRGFHLHAAEDKYDAVDCRHRFKKDILARLDKSGLLNSKSIIAHGTWLSREELELANEKDAFLVHNPRSNMNNAVGYAAWLAKAKNAALGTDGVSLDMLEELRAGCFRHRESGGPLWPADFQRMLAAGSRILERHFGGIFGRLEPEAEADLVIWDYDPPTPLSADNLAGHLAFGLSSRSVNSVMIGGRFVLENGKPAFDEPAVMAGAREEAVKLWSRMEGLA